MNLFFSLVFTMLQMFAPNVGQASRAGRTEKKKKITLHDSIFKTIAWNSIKKRNFDKK